MKRIPLTGLLSMSLIFLALLVLPALVTAQETVTVQLDAVNDSGVNGTATLTAAGEGTDVALEVQGLPADAVARATMHAGICDMPSASFAALPDLQADASGTATATGSVLFRGTDAVALATMADGEHIIAVQTDTVVACGAIPALASAPAPSTLPTTGGVASVHLFVVASVLGLGALLAGLLLQRRSRPARRF